MRGAVKRAACVAQVEASLDAVDLRSQAVDARLKRGARLGIECLFSPQSSEHPFDRRQPFAMFH